MKMIAPVLFAWLVGLVVGFIPSVEEFLRVYAMLVIPVFPILIWAGVGWVMFKICFLTDFKPSKFQIVILSVFAAVGYTFTDIGIYFMTSITVKGAQNIPDGEYTYSQLLSFWDYLQWRLSSSSYSVGRTGSNAMELGGGVTKLFYFGEIIGSFLACYVTMQGLDLTNPFCEKCDMFYSKLNTFEIPIESDESAIQEKTNQINECFSMDSYNELMTTLRSLLQPSIKNPDIRYIIDHRACKSCKKAVLNGYLETRADRGYAKVDDSEISYESMPGVQRV